MRDACDGSGLVASADTMGLLDFEDTSARIDHARMFGESESPRFGGFGQFRIDILSFVEKCDGLLVKKSLGIVEKLRQRRQRPCGHDLRFDPLGKIARGLDSDGMDDRPRSRHPRRLAQEGRLLEIALEKMGFK